MSTAVLEVPATVDTSRLARIYARMTTAADLEGMDFPPLRWLVPGLLLEGGVAILAGRPKIGKSWLALQIANAIAEGVPVLGREVTRGEVLYLALEDSLRRLKSRSDLLGSLWTSKLRFFTEWSKGPDAISDLRNLLEYMGTVSMVVIDVVAKIFPCGTDHNDYGAVGEYLEGFKRLAAKHGTGFLLLHHCGKTVREDFVDGLIGSTAFSSTADTVIGLKRVRGAQEAVLSATGRDIEEAELALTLSLPGGWRSLGDARQVTMSPERKAIVDLLTREGPLGCTEIARILYKEPSTIRTLLLKLQDSGQAVQEIDRRWNARSGVANVAKSEASVAVAARGGATAATVATDTIDATNTTQTRKQEEAQNG